MDVDIDSVLFEFVYHVLCLGGCVCLFVCCFPFSTGALFLGGLWLYLGDVYVLCCWMMAG